MKRLQGLVVAALFAGAALVSMGATGPFAAQITAALRNWKFADGTTTAPGVSFALEPTSGWYRNAATDIRLVVGGNDELRAYQNGLLIRSDAFFSWANGTSLAIADTNVSRTAAGTIGVTGAMITVGSGTGITVNNAGAIEWQVYKVTIDKTNFIAGAVTADVTLATLPAKTILSWMTADLTQAFVCGSVCTTATLSITCGKTAGGAEYLVSFDADAATGQFGNTQATVGAALKTATPPVTPLGDLPSWASTTAVQCRLTSGTGFVGTGAATNLSAGSVTFYLATTRLP